MPSIFLCRFALFMFAATLFGIGCSAPTPYKKVDIGQKETYTGLLTYDLFYGPPGFGEDTANDEKEPTYILHLTTPILFRDTDLVQSDNPIPGNTIGYDTVRTIHIRADAATPASSKTLQPLTGKKIKLECTLYGAHTGHHHAPALIEQVYSVGRE